MALGIADSPHTRTAAKAGLEPSQIGRKLRRLCGLFVFINNSKVFLIHQTVREFLLKKGSSHNVEYLYSWTLTDVEHQMAVICLRYLLMDDLEDANEDSRSNIRSFLDYSAVYWPDHVRKMSLTQDAETINQLHQVYAMTPRRFSLWFPIFGGLLRPSGICRQCLLYIWHHLTGMSGRSSFSCLLREIIST
jgi:hypothetical protein